MRARLQRLLLPTQLAPGSAGTQPFPQSSPGHSAGICYLSSLAYLFLLLRAPAALMSVCQQAAKSTLFLAEQPVYSTARRTDGVTLSGAVRFPSGRQPKKNVSWFGVAGHRANVSRFSQVTTRDKWHLRKSGTLG